MSSAPKTKPKRRRRAKSDGGRKLPAVEYLLVAACLASAIVLMVSELATTFQLVNPGGEALDPAGGVGVSGGERHGYVMFVISFFALFCLALAVLGGSKPAAMAVAVAGGLALLLFLITDLPDAGQEGALNEPVFLANAEVVPRTGFWLELIGALGLAVSGAALATLTPEQLSIGERWAARRKGEKDEEAGAGGTDDEAKPPSKPRRREESEKPSDRVKDRVERARRRGAD